MELTLLSRVLLDKMIVAQLVKKLPALLRNAKIHYSVHNSSPLNPILSHFNPVHTLFLKD
jgi:hypothetical protein